MLANEKFTDLYLNAKENDGQGRHYWKMDGNVMLLPDAYQGEAEYLYQASILIGRPVFCVSHGELRYRGQMLEHLSGRTVVLRRLSTDLPRWQDLGFPPGVLTTLINGNSTLGIKSLLENKAGLVLVSGETDAGKSTTLAALMRELLLLKSWVGVTIEDPAEYQLAGKNGHGYCYQQDVDSGRFADALRDVLRVNPDIILLGEIRDPETAATCLSAAITGHLVLTTVHAASVAQSIARIVALASQIRTQADVADLLSNSFVCGIHQRLIRQNGAGRKLVADVLFASTPVRTYLRSGRSDLIQSEIETQKSMSRTLRTVT